MNRVIKSTFEVLFVVISVWIIFSTFEVAIENASHNPEYSCFNMWKIIENNYL